MWWLALDRDITSHVGAIVNSPDDISQSRGNQSQAKFKSAVGGNLQAAKLGEFDYSWLY